MTDVGASEPQRSKGDIAHAIARGALSSVPIAGGAISVLFEEVFQRPLEKRRLTWISTLAEVVEELSQRVEGFDASRLAENEMFLTSAVQASQIAQRTHQSEKLDALRNAVQNAALPNAPDDDQQLIYLRLIDHLTTWHLRILALFDGPEGWFKEHSEKRANASSGSSVLESAYPELRGQRGFYDQLVSDLQSEGLISNGSFLHAMMTPHGAMASRTTPSGKAFLRFIQKQI
jgi:hypothetical protein